MRCNILLEFITLKYDNANKENLKYACVLVQFADRCHPKTVKDLCALYIYTPYRFTFPPFNMIHLRKMKWDELAYIVDDNNITTLPSIVYIVSGAPTLTNECVWKLTEN